MSRPAITRRFRVAVDVQYAASVIGDTDNAFTAGIRLKIRFRSRTICSGERAFRSAIARPRLDP
jgi:hypothetical protein